MKETLRILEVIRTPVRTTEAFYKWTRLSLKRVDLNVGRIFSCLIFNRIPSKMLFHKLSILTALLAKVYAHGYVDNVTVAGVLYTVSRLNPTLNTAGMLMISKSGIPTIHRSLLQPNSRSNHSTHPRQRTCPRRDIDRPSMRWLHSRWCLWVFSSKVDGWACCGRKYSFSALDPLAGQPCRTCHHIHGEVCKRWLHNIYAWDIVSYILSELQRERCLHVSSAVWFKVAEAGRVGTSGVWGDSPLMVAGNSYTYTIPSCLAAGSYIVRHEIIALHSAGTYPGAQFYPSCHQIKVTGSGTSTGPTSKVAFPGTYKSTDPGITYDMYTAQTYTIPGPAVFTC